MPTMSPTTAVLGLALLAMSACGDDMTVTDGTQPGALTANGTSCGEILSCYGGCPDQACYDACYNAGTPTATALIDELDACISVFLCETPSCVSEYCQPKVNKCRADIGAPAGAYVCRAQGVYTVCGDYGCIDEFADGAGWATDEASAGVAATKNCSDHMLSLVIASNVNGSASVKINCDVTSCERQ